MSMAPMRQAIFFGVVWMAVAGCGSGGGGEARRFPSESRDGLSQCPTSVVEGVDVSDGNGTIDWAQVKGSGVGFAYMKATQGTTFTASSFARNWSGTVANGVLRGAYHFFDPTLDGVLQAQHFLAVMGPLQPGDLPPMLDAECPDGDDRCLGYAGGTGIAPAATIHQRMVDFLDTVEAATGRRPGIYTYPSYFSGNGVVDTDFAADPLWLANLSPVNGCFSVPQAWSRAAIWQYGWHGVVPGISGEVDVDRFMGTADELQAFGQGSPFRLHRRQVADLDGDGKADVCGRDADGVHCWLMAGGGLGAAVTGPALTDATGWSKPQYASTLQWGDLDGDGRSDLCARGASGMKCWLSTGTGFGPEIAGPPWSDAAGWDVADRYQTIQFADVDGDGKADLCGRDSTGLVCYLSDGAGFPTQVLGPHISDNADWNHPQYYETIRMVDIDGDGRDDLCGRAKAGIVCWLSTGTGFGSAIVSGPAWSDASGWDAALYRDTIQWADVDGDGKQDVCARGPAGVECWLSSGAGFPTKVTGPAWSDATGWNTASTASTVQWADIDGDGKADVCGRSATGVSCFLSSGTAFPTAVAGPGLTDASGWDGLPYFWTIELSDVTGDGRADLCARASSGYRCYASQGTSFATSFGTGEFSDTQGWDAPLYFASVTLVGGLPGRHASTSSTSTGSTSTGSSSTGSSSSSSTGASGSTGSASGTGTTGAGSAGSAGSTGGTLGTSTTGGNTVKSGGCGCQSGDDALGLLGLALLGLLRRRSGLASQA
jgi:MYXO-CTERM domain-containing protein